MENEMNPPAGEVKLPPSNPPVNPALMQAARSLHRCRLPVQADTTIADAVADLEALLYHEGAVPDDLGTDARMLKQVAVLDNLFHSMVFVALNPKYNISEDKLKLALRMQKLCKETAESLRRKPVPRAK